MTRAVFVGMATIAAIGDGIGIGFALCLGDAPGAIVFGLAALACLIGAAWVAK